MKVNIVLSILFLNLMLLSCHNKTEETVIPDSGLIEISKDQFKSENMEFGGPTLSSFSDVVHFTGTVIPSVNGREQISLALPGLIKKIYCKPGQPIAIGSVLFEISGNELVDLQKDFAESSAVLIRLESEYLRIMELFKAKIAAEKEFIQAESDYHAEKAKFNALKIKLENLGLDLSSIEKGTFINSYQVRSPLNGYVTTIEATTGQYVEPYEKIAELIDADSYQLKISVFEKDIFKLAVGQDVKFFVSSDKSQIYSATVSIVGQLIMNDTKSIDCYAAIEKSAKSQLVGNQFVEGDIFIAVDTVLSVLNTAIIKADNASYILVLESESDEIYYLKKYELTAGRKNDNFVELSDEIPAGKILVRGTYNIQVE